jgi:hypothetical protein
MQHPPSPIVLGACTYPGAREKILGGVDARIVYHWINRQRTSGDGGTNVFGGDTWARNLELHVFKQKHMMSVRIYTWNGMGVSRYLCKKSKICQ